MKTDWQNLSISIFRPREFFYIEELSFGRPFWKLLYVALHAFFYKKVSIRLINKNFLKKSVILLIKSFLRLSYFNFHKKAILFNIYNTFLILSPDEKGQKVPCRLIFEGRSRFVSILREQLNLLM